MKPMKKSAIRKKSRAFSLVEVVVALGVVSFSLVAVVNILPAGLESQKQALDQSFATQALSRVSGALQGVYVEKDNAGLPTGNLKFPPPLENLAIGDTEEFYYLLGNGSLTTTNERTAVGRLRIEQRAKTNSLQPVYVSVAWPARAVFNSKWTKAEGSQSTMFYINLPQP
jgi:type II secretory pathway pseudopilin PulG